MTMKHATTTATPAIGMARRTTSPARGTLDAIADTLALWRERTAQRHRLRDIDDHLLVDMGLTRADIDRESRKPFWLA
jgi:uncharacterized protein YjiS (DUF1127 family)